MSEAQQMGAEQRRLREMEEAERRRRELEERRMQEERRPAQPRAEPRQDRGTIGPRDLSGFSLEREERRDLMEAVRPTGEESMEAQAFSSAVEAQREAEALRGTVPGEDLEYQRRVQEERTRLQQMREDPGRWTVETEPGSGEYRSIVGRDIDVRERELSEYEAGYGEWRGGALGGAEGLDRYAQEMYGSVEAGSEERGRAARDYEKAMARWREQAFMPEAKPREGEAGPRSVLDTRSPTVPSEELSLVSHDLPADVMPLYTEGTPPTTMEQLLGVARVPSQLARGVEAIGIGARERLPETGWALLPTQTSYVLEGLAGGAAGLIDPATYLGLPGALMAAGTYASTAGWNRISADVSRTLGEYRETRMANPALLYRDVGYQIGAAWGFRAVTGLGARAVRGTAGALRGLPGDPIGFKGLGVISGEGPVPFRQAWQLARQRAAGLGSDVLGSRGLAAIGGEALPLRQLLQVVRRRGGISGDALGTRGLAAFTGYTGASAPFRQTAEVWLRRASLRNLMVGEAAGGGLAAMGADPALLPIKQLLQVVRQKGSLGSDVLGSVGMGTRGVSLKALWKFATMPGAEEPFTGVAHRGPAFSSRDISGLLRIKAREAAEFRAGNMEAFMKATFQEPRGPVVGAPDTSVVQLLQMKARGGASPWGVDAVDVFPYEVLSYPPGDELLDRAKLRHVERPGQPTFIRQETALKQTLRDATKLRVGEKPGLLLDQAQLQRQVFKPMERPRLRQPPALKGAQLQLPGLQMFQEQAQQQKQRQRLMGAMAFPPPPSQQGLRMPRFEGGPGLGEGSRRGYKGKRKTYPVRDPLSLLDEMLEKPKRRGRGKKRGPAFI